MPSYIFIPPLFLGSSPFVNWPSLLFFFLVFPVLLWVCFVVLLMFYCIIILDSRFGSQMLKRKGLVLMRPYDQITM